MQTTSGGGRLQMGGIVRMSNSLVVDQQAPHCGAADSYLAQRKPAAVASPMLLGAPFWSMA